MRPAGRLAAYAVAVAVAAGAAAGVGLAVGPVEDESPAPAPAHADAAGTQEGEDEMTMSEHGGPAASGLAVADDDYRLVLDDASRTADQPEPLRFRIVDRAGATVDGMELHGGVRMHLIVIRRDLTGYQHLHPTLQSDGSWAIALTLPDAGAYRAFVDFERDGERTVLGADLLAAGAFTPVELPAPRRTQEVDGFHVGIAGDARADQEAEIAFRVTSGDGLVALEDYLGAKGHLVALRAGDLAYLHVHPKDGGAHGAIAFEATFPSAGTYRLFLQFQVDGRVHTAAFTLEVGS